MGLIKSLILKFKKEKVIKTKRPGDILTYKQFALKDICHLTIRGPICKKDVDRLVEIAKQYGFLKVLNIESASEILEISNNQFHGCDCLEKVVLPQGLLRIGESAFESCRCLNEVVIPDSLQTISKSAFYACYSLKEITITKNIKYIGNWALACKNLESIKVSEHNIQFKSINNILFSNDGSTLLKYPSHKPESRYEVPEGVKVIANAAFQDCVDLQEIELPDSLEEIGDNAFLNTQIKTLSVPDGVKKIGKLAFSHNTQLTEVYLPGSINRLGERAFTECHKLSKVTIGNGITGIEDNVFANCHSLKTVDLPQSAYKVME
ncbi:MAG: leucine-rich repeat domain-containing protein [Paludibacteraceae bacterium]|nr:leucine-rich repeat domain-containing protein [Paludibacteraceae bacterium]